MSPSGRDPDDEVGSPENEDASFAERSFEAYWPSVSRRRLLKLVGGGATASALSAGTAVAHDRVYTEADETQSGTAESVGSLVDRMTLEEKVRKVHNHFGSGAPELPIGYMAPTPRLDMPHMELADGPVGVRHPFLVDDPDPENVVVGTISGGPSTAFPASISQVATWSRDRIGEFGFALGREAKAKGQGVMYAPAFNIMRVPVGGRTFEYFGEDPYLAGRGAVSAVRGIQSAGTIATAKHYVANNHETNRMTVSVDVSERTLREIYLPAFRAAVEEADVGSVMAAYNRVNGTPCTENAHLLTEILKEEWGFEGYVVSDYGAVQSTVGAANAGTDFEGYVNEAQEGYFGPELREAVENGSVSMATLDDKIRRILTQQERFGILQDEREGPPGEANTQKHQQLARQIAAEGGVLLKNDEPGLPLDLDGIGSIAVIGHKADQAKVGGGGSSNVTPPYEISPLAGIRSHADEDTVVEYAKGKETTVDAVALAERSDIAVVVANGSSTEGGDRDDLTLNGNQNDLISAVAAVNDQTVVVLRTGGPVVMPWVDEVPAILEMWYPGMEDGNATAELLFGEVNPSGRLPITFGKRREDYPATTAEQYPGVDQGDGYPVAEYSEGVFVGYRHFDEEDIEPLFPFGHGLSYTEFQYTDLEVTPSNVQPSEDIVVDVEVDITNIGERVGEEVVQLYVSDKRSSVDRPPKELKEFTKEKLVAGESQSVRFRLEREAFSYYDTDEGEWVVESGDFEILVGSSSRDVRLREEISIQRAHNSS